MSSALASLLVTGAVFFGCLGLWPSQRHGCFRALRPGGRPGSISVVRGPAPHLSLAPGQPKSARSPRFERARRR